VAAEDPRLLTRARVTPHAYESPRFTPRPSLTTGGNPRANQGNTRTLYAQVSEWFRAIAAIAGKFRTLIRGFGVQVPGGAPVLTCTPVLTWGFITLDLFYVSVLSTWLLRGCSRARTRNSGLVKNGASGARCGGHSPRNRAVSYGRHRPAVTRPMV
jgi:hypothetical protein